MKPLQWYVVHVQFFYTLRSKRGVIRRSVGGAGPGSGVPISKKGTNFHMLLTNSMPIYNKKSHQARAGKCVKFFVRPFLQFSCNFV